MKTFSPLKSKSGQAVVELVLLSVFVVAVSTAVTNYIQSNEVFQNIVRGPWQSLSGMFQNGAWGSPEATMNLHPSHNTRLGSYLPEGNDL